VTIYTAHVNMLTVDVEDWQQSVVNNRLPVSGRVIDNTRRVLNILRMHRVRGTFFVQSLVAEQYPDLVRDIARDGHEVGSHGHTHHSLVTLTPETLAAELDQSLRILRPLVDEPVSGYRAPNFSVGRDTLWALPVIRDAGFRYSSSIFPFDGRRYGIGDARLEPHEIIPGLLEVPLAVVEVAGHRLPVAGGGYLRLAPYRLTRLAIRRIAAAQRSTVVYVHPYELDPGEVWAVKAHAPLHLRLMQGFNRRATERKLHALLSEFRFAPVREVVRLHGGAPQPRVAESAT
jgi:polysaccharide deacetylase family protein (PEP-CTERM system associated)